LYFFPIDLFLKKDDGSLEEFFIVISAPFTDATGWNCQIDVEGPTQHEEIYCHGATSMETLCLAIRLVHSYLLAHKVNGNQWLYYANRKNFCLEYYFFPTPKNFNPPPSTVDADGAAFAQVLLNVIHRQESSFVPVLLKNFESDG
jgi:hypothetical protein